MIEGGEKGGRHDMHLRKPPVRKMTGAVRAVWAVLSSRRQLDLPRWTRGQAFAELHNTVVAWLDGHLAAVERGAPWLRRVGIDVSDHCRGRVNSPFRFSLAPRDTAALGCTRNVIAVYGFDGALTQRLEQCGQSLSAAGWERSGPLPLRAWTGSEGDASLRWRPDAALSYPPGLSTVPPWGLAPLSPQMWLSWSSGGQNIRQLQQNPHRTSRNTRNRLAVESSGTEYWKLPDTALTYFEHTLTVHMSLAYYADSNPLDRRHRIPRYLLPTPAR
jgi:hypothetical protein